MPLTLYKMLVTLDNGKEIVYRNGMREDVAFRTARKLRALGYGVKVISGEKSPEVTKAVAEVIKGIYGSG